MRRSFVLAVFAGTALAATPTAAQFDLGEWTYVDLYDDWRLSMVLGGDVVTADGYDAGDVEDVRIDETGLIQEVVVETDSYKTPRGRYMAVAWTDVDFEPATGTVELLETLSTVNALDTTESEPMVEAGRWSGVQLTAMPVSLAEEPWGTVDDMIFDHGTGHLTAYVVEPTEGDTALYALPYVNAWIAPAGDLLDLPYGPDAMVGLDAFEYGEMGS